MKNILIQPDVLSHVIATTCKIISAIRLLPFLLHLIPPCTHRRTVVSYIVANLSDIRNKSDTATMLCEWSLQSRLVVCVCVWSPFLGSTMHRCEILHPNCPRCPQKRTPLSSPVLPPFPHMYHCNHDMLFSCTYIVASLVTSTRD